MKRGNTTAANTYVGPLGELLVDTGLKTIRVQDGVTPGGMSTLATNVQLQALGTYANATFGTSSYGNANVALYLSTSSIISNINANITAANAAITSLQSNAAIQASLLDTLTGNAATQSTVLDTLTANAATQATTLTSLLGNAVAQQTSLTDLVANAATQAQAIAAATGTYSNANVKSYLASFDGNILPSANVTYSLGDATHQWRDLWVSNNTIYIGNTPIRVDGGTLLVNNAPITGTTSSLVNGNATLQLFANGQSRSPDTLFAGNGVSIINANGAIQGGIYNSGDADWFNIGASTGRGFKFYVNEETEGPLFFANGSVNVPNNLYSAAGVIGDVGMYGGTIWGNNPAWNNLTLASQVEGYSYVQIPSDATANVANLRIHNDIGNVEITTGDGFSYNYWYFGNDGDLTIPRDIFGTGTNPLVIQNTSTGSAYLELPIAPGTNPVYLSNQDPTGNVVIRTGDFGSENDWTFGMDGNLTIPGNITMGPGSGRLISVVTPEPGLVSWEFGMDGNLTVPGNINYANGQSILSGIGGASLGNLYMLNSTTIANGMSSYLDFSSPVRLGHDLGNVQIIVTNQETSNTYEFTFANIDGSLNLPGNIISGGGQIQFIANSSGDGNGYATMRLFPDIDREFWDQYLIIDPTAPGHIHIRAGGTQDNSNADLILGGENSHVRVTAGSNPPVYIKANSASWTFGVDSGLSMPTGGNLYFDNSAVSVIDGITNINAIGTIGANVVQVLSDLTSFGASPAPVIYGFRSISTTGSAVNEGNISASGNLVASQNAYVTGNVFAAQYNYANGVSISQSIQNGISNVRVLSSGGLVSINVGGASNIALFTTTGASIGGTLSTSGFTATGAVTLATASGNINIGASQTTGHVNMGGTAQTGTILIGQSTYSQTINIGHGITGSGNTKTIQIGENGAAGSATLIDIGPATASATGTVTFNTGTVVTIANTGSNALSVAGNITGGNVTAAQYNFANGVNILSTVGAGSYGNTEVAAYLPAYTGNVGAARVQVTNAVDFMYGGFPYMGWQLSGSDTLKLRTNIASGDYTNDAIIVDRQSLAVNVVATLTTGNIITTSGLFWANGTAYATSGSSYGNIEVAAYLPTYIGNVGAGNVNVTSTVYAANIVTSGTSGNISGVNVISANTFVFASNGVNILSAAGGGTYGNTEVAAYLLTWPNIDSNILDATSANITTLRAPNFNSANAVISGGYISALTNASIITATITTLNSTGGNITTLRATNFGTANAVITGGYINSLANLTATTAVLTNLSTGNAVISGGYISALTNAYITTSAITNFSTANAVITGGYASGLANVTVTGNVTAGNLIGYGSNTSIIAGAYTSTFDNVGMVTVPNLTVSGSVDATSITTDSLTINDTGWTNFTPTWYAGTGTNSVGDGLAEGRYRQLGKTVEVWMQITMGSTTTFGTGEYKVSLPVASRMLGSAVLSLVMSDTGTRLYNSLAHNAYTTTLFHTSSNVTLFWDTGVVTNTSPFTWTNGDFFVIAGTYEAS